MRVVRVCAFTECVSGPRSHFCQHRLAVDRQFGKLEVRVRLPLLAPEIKNHGDRPWHLRDRRIPKLGFVRTRYGNSSEVSRKEKARGTSPGLERDSVLAVYHMLA